MNMFTNEMFRGKMLVQTYFAYLAISIALTIWVARTLFKHGRVFLVDVFAGNEAIADSVNHLLVVGFYLINLGFIAFFLKAGDPVNSAQVAVEFLSTKIGVVVLVGGVRRSALISLSDLDDLGMRDLKHGQWWVDSPHLSLANNSAVYEGRPTEKQFLSEWKALKDSFSGERGIFNRKAAEAQASKSGRRDTAGVEYGVNPCR